MARFPFLLRELVVRDLQSRYTGSLLGLLWAFVHPLWQLALFSFVFSFVLRVPLAGEATASFPIFLFAGLLPWLGVQEGVARATSAVSDNASLVKKLRFPSQLLVASTVLSALVHQGIALAVFAGILGLRGELVPAALLWLIPAALAQLALTGGLGLLCSSLQVYFRDVGQLVGIALSAWFYLTPIVYPLALVPERFRALLVYNPLAALVGLYRTALLGGSPPPAGALWALAGGALGLLGVGYALFRHLSPGFPDEL